MFTRRSSLFISYTLRPCATLVNTYLRHNPELDTSYVCATLHTMMTERIGLSVQEVAERMKVNEETVRRWYRAGVLKGRYTTHGPNRGWHTTEAELEQFRSESGQ